MAERFRVGVTNGAGVYRQYALVNRERLAALGIYLGSDLAADVVLDAAEPWHARVYHDGDGFVVEAIGGATVDRAGPSTLVIEDSRIELGVAPRAGVPDRVMPMRTVIPAGVKPLPPPPPEPPPPPPPPPPQPPIVLAVPVTPASCLAALVAYIAQQPRRMHRSAAMSEVLDTGVPESLRPLFERWRDHRVGQIFIGDLLLGDSFLGTRLPVMVKGELYGEVDVDYGTARTDLLVIGRFRGGSVAFYRDGLRDSVRIIEPGRGTEIWAGSLAEEVCRAVRDAHAGGTATDLDPFIQL